MICFILLLAIITACEPLHNGSAVIIVKTWTDIERGLPISLVTETDLLTRPKQDEMILHAKIPSVFCTRVQLTNTRKADLTINHMDTTKTILVQDDALTVSKNTYYMHSIEALVNAQHEQLAINNMYRSY